MSLYARSACDKRQERQLINYILLFALRIRDSQRFFFLYVQKIRVRVARRAKGAMCYEKKTYIYIYFFFINFA